MKEWNHICGYFSYFKVIISHSIQSKLIKPGNFRTDFKNRFSHSAIVYSSFWMKLEKSRKQEEEEVEKEDDCWGIPIRWVADLEQNIDWTLSYYSKREKILLVWNAPKINSASRRFTVLWNATRCGTCATLFAAIFFFFFSFPRSIRAFICSVLFFDLYTSLAEWDRCRRSPKNLGWCLSC